MRDKGFKIELLAPAGDLNKLKTAFLFGADAVYCGLPDFSLRVRINRFTPENLYEGVVYAHKLKKRVYVTLNIYGHNWHLEKMPKHILFLKKIGVDGIIVSDPGVLDLIQEYWPEAEIHLSTQANAINWRAVRFWRKNGIKRIILARETTLEEIKEIRQKVKGVSLECFVHGAMCMSYSGRCILSKWMTNRSANLGDCAQPCRWGYFQKVQNKEITGQNIKKDFSEMSVIDNQLRFEINLEEDCHGTYFFNSYDMNLIEHLDKLLIAGIDSLKIEGRAKSVYYVAIVTRAYRKVLEALFGNLSKKDVKKTIIEQKKELEKLVHRGYSTGFLFGQEPAHNFNNQNKKPTFQFVGEIMDQKNEINEVRVHNQVSLEDILEGITPEKNLSLSIKKIMNYQGELVAVANGGHKNNYFFQFNSPLPAGSLLRKKVV